MDEAIQDCIGNCGISHGPMPMLQGELTGQDGGTMLAAVIYDIQHVSALRSTQGGQAPVIQSKEAKASQLAHKFGIRAVTPGHCQIGEQF